MIMGEYCVGMYAICYLGYIMIIGAYCEGNAHIMLSWKYFDNWSILCW